MLRIKSVFFYPPSSYSACRSFSSFLSCYTYELKCMLFEFCVPELCCLEHAESMKIQVSHTIIHPTSFLSLQG